jgi:RNA polymerase sigma-70 factor (ECF subfamily)
MTKAAELRDEAQLIASIISGEAHLFHELIRPYERKVYVMALSFLKNEADAEDAAQEAFLRAYRNLASFRSEAKFGTWLISITLNEARGRLRKAKAVVLQALDEEPDAERHVSPALLRDWREIPSEALERQEIRSQLQAVVGQLPPKYREIFLLRDVEELSIAEAAEVLQITESSVKVRLHRARIMLQKVLAPQLRHMTPRKDSQRRRWFPWL